MKQQRDYKVPVEATKVPVGATTRLLGNQAQEEKMTRDITDRVINVLGSLVTRIFGNCLPPQQPEAQEYKGPSFFGRG